MEDRYEPCFVESCTAQVKIPAFLAHRRLTPVESTAPGKAYVDLRCANKFRYHLNTFEVHYNEFPDSN